MVRSESCLCAGIAGEPNSKSNLLCTKQSPPLKPGRQSRRHLATKSSAKSQVLGAHLLSHATSIFTLRPCCMGTSQRACARPSGNARRPPRATTSRTRTRCVGPAFTGVSWLAMHADVSCQSGREHRPKRRSSSALRTTSRKVGKQDMWNKELSASADQPNIIFETEKKALSQPRDGSTPTVVPHLMATLAVVVSLTPPC